MLEASAGLWQGRLDEHCTASWCAALPWEPFGVPFKTKGFFHRKIRVWRELCSIPEHVPGSPASLETAVATALAKPRC